MNSMTIDGYIRNMEDDRLKTFNVLLEAEIKAKEKNEVVEPISIGAKDNPTVKESDALWLQGISLDCLKELDIIVKQETERRST